MMKKEKVVYKIGSFLDFTNKERQVVFCAISTLEDSEVWSETDDNEVIAEKTLRIGLAVQNPADDVANVELSKIISKGKAIKKPIGELFSTNLGMINSKMVEALLSQELEYFQLNPGKYLAGYNKDKQLYLTCPDDYFKKFKISK